jgi:hypothetical protein
MDQRRVEDRRQGRGGGGRTVDQRCGAAVSV